MMAKFREKKPVVEAVQFFTERTPHPQGVKKMPDSRGWKRPFYIYRPHVGPSFMEEGDWIITEGGGCRIFPPDCPCGGDIYLCKPDIFEQTYELVFN